MLRTTPPVLSGSHRKVQLATYSKSIRFHSGLHSRCGAECLKTSGSSVGLFHEKQALTAARYLSIGWVDQRFLRGSYSLALSGLVYGWEKCLSCKSKNQALLTLLERRTTSATSEGPYTNLGRQLRLPPDTQLPRTPQPLLPQASKPPQLQSHLLPHLQHHTLSPTYGRAMIESAKGTVLGEGTRYHSTG